MQDTVRPTVIISRLIGRRGVEKERRRRGEEGRRKGKGGGEGGRRGRRGGEEET